MTTDAKKRLKAIHQDIKKNTPRIRQRLKRLGIKGQGPMIVSTAKYYEALNKLAKE